MRAGLTLMIFVGTYLLGRRRADSARVPGFLLLGKRVFEPLTMVLTNYAEIRYALLSAERIMEIRHEQRCPAGPPT
jgi:ATP-binding cassette subfamily B protein